MKIKKEKKNQKMNPIWVILVFVILVIVVIYRVNVNEKNSEYSIEKIYQANSSNVDLGTETLMNHEGFDKLDTTTKVVEMGKLLRIYEQVGVIANLYYAEDTTMYTFTYNTGDISGALGGVSLKKWDPYMN